MAQHQILDRSDADLLWYQRRSFLSAAAAWAASGGFVAAHAQARSNIVELQGDALLNGQRLRPEQTIQSGDEVQTGPGSDLVFVIGTSSFRVRPASRLVVERGATLSTVSLLRLVQGAVASVWNRGGPRQIVTPTLTAGIRGTGVYTEVPAGQGGRSYLCNCYGTIDLETRGELQVTQTEYHQAFWAELQPRNGRYIVPAPAINHGDEEMEMLARLLGQRTAWQISGRKGTKDDPGYSTVPTPVAPGTPAAR
jgi:hypothetical protein